MSIFWGENAIMYTSDMVTVSIGLGKTAVNHRAQKQNIITLYFLGEIASIGAGGKVVQSFSYIFFCFFYSLLVIE